MTLTSIAKHGLIGVAIAGSTLAGCSSVQTTLPGTVGVDRSQRMSSLVSEADLRKGAAQAYRQVLDKERGKGNLDAEPAMTARVQGIAWRIVPQTAVFRPDAPGWGWEVHVIRSDEVNAWCMPGGKIAFYTGLLDDMALSDDEVAAVMGHEIAHALREHARERASERATANLALTAAVALFGGGQASMDMANLAYGVTVGLPHSRLHEAEADRIGVELAARAGYDPKAAVSLWQKMSRVGGAKGPELLSTHPSAETRSIDLQVYAARVMPLYEQARRSR
jgi:predicted Zn-dependent protease